MRQNQSWFFNVLYDISNGKRFSRACNAKQNLGMIASVNTGHKLFDGLRLIAGGNKIGNEAEIHLVKIAIAGCYTMKNILLC